jgi:hypothetical protein
MLSKKSAHRWRKSHQAYVLTHYELCLQKHSEYTSELGLNRQTAVVLLEGLTQVKKYFNGGIRQSNSNIQN